MYVNVCMYVCMYICIYTRYTVPISEVFLRNNDVCAVIEHRRSHLRIQCMYVCIEPLNLCIYVRTYVCMYVCMYVLFMRGLFMQTTLRFQWYLCMYVCMYIVDNNTVL